MGDAVGAAFITPQFHLWIAYGVAQSNFLYDKHGATACQQCSGWMATTTDIPVRADLHSTMYHNAAAWFMELSPENKTQLLLENPDKTIASAGYHPHEALHMSLSANGTITYHNECAVRDHVCVQCATLALASARIAMTADAISGLSNDAIRHILQAAINTPMAIAAMDTVCPQAMRRETTPLWQPDGFLKILQHSAEVCPFNLAQAPVWPYEKVEVGTHPTVHADFWKVLASVMTAAKGQHRPAFGLSRRDSASALQRITSTLKRERDHADPPTIKGGKSKPDPDNKSGKGKKGGRGGPGPQTKMTKNSL